MNCRNISGWCQTIHCKLIEVRTNFVAWDCRASTLTSRSRSWDLRVGRYILKSTILVVEILPQTALVCLLSPQKVSTRKIGPGTLQTSLSIIWTILHSTASPMQSPHAELSCSQDQWGSSTDIKSISSAQETALRQLPNELEILVPGIETRHRPTTELNYISDIAEVDSCGHSDRPADDTTLEISGTGHWLLEGWIGDHPVHFIVDSGTLVTAISDYSRLDWHRLENKSTNIILWSASGTTIRASGSLTCYMPVLFTNFSQLQWNLSVIWIDHNDVWHPKHKLNNNIHDTILQNSRSSTSLAWAGGW